MHAWHVAVYSCLFMAFFIHVIFWSFCNIVNSNDCGNFCKRWWANPLPTLLHIQTSYWRDKKADAKDTVFSCDHFGPNNYFIYRLWITGLGILLFFNWGRIVDIRCLISNLLYSHHMEYDTGQSFGMQIFTSFRWLWN